MGRLRVKVRSGLTYDNIDGGDVDCNTNYVSCNADKCMFKHPTESECLLSTITQDTKTKAEWVIRLGKEADWI